MEYDYVIVGGGSAGCLLANRLSARHRVLLLEAGGGGRGNIWLKIPIGYLYTMGSAKTDWCYVLEENEFLAGRKLNYPRGKVLGGSSAINGMLYIRGQAQDYDGWAKTCPGWSWREVLPYFIRHEKNFALGGEFHGKNGEVAVSPVISDWPVLDAFLESANACGVPKTEDFNTGDNFGVGYFQVNQINGVRQTAADAFLRPAVLARDNLTVTPRAHVRRVVLANRRAVAVEYWDGGGTLQTARAAGEIVLAAGGVGSPQILQCSGVGAPELLKQTGAELRHALPGVGENLQDHLQIRAAFKVKNAKTLNESSRGAAAKIKMGLDYVLRRRGPLASAPSQLCCFAFSDGAAASPDIQYHVQPLSLDSFGSPLHDFPAFTASVCQLRPASRGFVRIASADSRRPPRIDARFLSAPEDRKTAANALRHVREICAQAPLQKYGAAEFMPGLAHQSDEELAAAAGRISTTIFHPCGTCKMGADGDETAVLDSRLRVRGLEGLRVADASAMPLIVSGNTNAPTMMLAEKAAEMILADAGK